MERHHITPLSLYGLDKECNIAVVSYHDHNLIHQQMNYPSHIFSKMWREFRKKHNGKRACDLAMVQDILAMQKGYLDRCKNLPKDLYFLHCTKLSELANFYYPYEGSMNYEMVWLAYKQRYLNYML